MASFIAVLAMETVCSQTPDPEPAARLISFTPRDLLLLASLLNRSLERSTRTMIMLRLAKDLWNDQAGFIVSAELVLISTVGVIGLVTGLTCVRNSVNAELSDVACAISSLDQSYCYTGFHSYKNKCTCVTKARTAGSTNVHASYETELVPIEEVTGQPIPEHAEGVIISETVISERVIGETVIGDPIPVPTPCQDATISPATTPEAAVPTPLAEPAKPAPAP